MQTTLLATTDVAGYQQSIIISSDASYLKSRITYMVKCKEAHRITEFLSNNQAYKHLQNDWPVARAFSRATESTMTRIRLNRSRLKSDLHRWHLVDSPLCPHCNQSSETAFHYFLVCPARSHQREELDQFFVRKDIINPLECIMTLSFDLEDSEKRLLQVLIDRYLMDTGLAYSRMEDSTIG
jgi:hypothetical protein